jgi:hypothetical protein
MAGSSAQGSGTQTNETRQKGAGKSKRRQRRQLEALYQYQQTPPQQTAFSAVQQQTTHPSCRPDAVQAHTRGQRAFAGFLQAQ